MIVWRSCVRYPNSPTYLVLLLNVTPSSTDRVRRPRQGDAHQGGGGAGREKGRRRRGERRRHRRHLDVDVALVDVNVDLQTRRQSSTDSARVECSLGLRVNSIGTSARLMLSSNQTNIFALARGSGFD